MAEPPIARYRLTLTIKGNTLDEIERELVVQTRGGFLLDSVPKYDAELAAWWADVAILAGVLGADLPEPAPKSMEEVMALLRPLIQRLSLVPLVAVLDLVRHMQIEHMFEVDVAPLAPVLRKSMRDWLSALSDTDTYGYTPTPWEVERVAEPDEEAPTPERPAGPVTDVKPTFVDDVDPATLADLLQLVQEGQREVTVDEIAAWDKDTRCDVADWASALHLLASDNDDVEVPEMPEVLRPVPDVADEDGD